MLHLAGGSTPDLGQIRVDLHLLQTIADLLDLRHLLLVGHATL